MSARFISALSLLLAGCGSEDPPYGEVRFPASKQIPVPPPMESISPDKLLPRVVHRSYFDAAGVADVDSEPDRFGIVRHLGNDLYAFLAHVDEDRIRNVQSEHLPDHNLTADAAWATATKNLRRIAFDGETIQQTVTKANDGRDWSVWLGNEFTSSTLLLPELFSWSRDNLRADSFLVRVASTQMVFIVQQSHAADLPDFDNYIAKVLEDSDNLISDKWFTLSESGTEFVFRRNRIW